MASVEINGRTIDTSCPYMGQCWSEGYCETPCPPTLLDVLRHTAELEHECELLPHTDPDIMAVCVPCNQPPPPKSIFERAKNAMMLNMNEIRKKGEH